MLSASSREHIANAGRLGSGPALGPKTQADASNEKGRHRPAFVRERSDQAKLLSANCQFTRLLRKVSTNLGRRLR
jgi:hypothetical protein